VLLSLRAFPSTASPEPAHARFLRAVRVARPETSHFSLSSSPPPARNNEERGPHQHQHPLQTLLHFTPAPCIRHTPCNKQATSDRRLPPRIAFPSLLARLISYRPETANSSSHPAFAFHFTAGLASRRRDSRPRPTTPAHNAAARAYPLLHQISSPSLLLNDCSLTSSLLYASKSKTLSQYYLRTKQDSITLPSVCLPVSPQTDRHTQSLSFLKVKARYTSTLRSPARGLIS
jgi:hypothetical protein